MSPLEFIWARAKLSSPWHRVVKQGDSLATTATCGFPNKTWMLDTSVLRPTDGRVCQNCEASL